MSKKYILLALILIVVAGIGVLMVKRNTPEEKTHYHAGFVVFEDGKKLDFTDIKYMNLEPCVAGGKKSGSDELEKAHLHDNIGDVLHVEATGAIWQDLFTNIKFPIDYASAAGFINGKKVENFQKQPIVKDDNLVVFIGKVDESLLSQAITVDRIEHVGATSKTCGD